MSNAAARRMVGCIGKRGMVTGAVVLAAVAPSPDVALAAAHNHLGKQKTSVGDEQELVALTAVKECKQTRLPSGNSGSG